MREAFESGLTGLLVLSAVATAVTLLHREFGQSREATSSGQAVKRVRSQAHRDSARIVLGDPSGKVRVTEFIDFECPFCRRFDSTVRQFVQQHPGIVTREVVHFPLTTHRFALPAARAAECAGEQDRFETMHRALYDKQDSLGLKSWASFAREAGIPDTTSFLKCHARSGDFRRIQMGLAAGEREGVTSTPTVIVGDWLFAVPPTERELAAAINDVLAGRTPNYRRSR